MGAEETGKVLATFCRQPSGVGMLHRDLGRVHKVPLHLIEQAVVVVNKATKQYLGGES
jgi:hypothetical protein